MNLEVVEIRESKIWFPITVKIVNGHAFRLKTRISCSERKATCAIIEHDGPASADLRHHHDVEAAVAVEIRGSCQHRTTGQIEIGNTERGRATRIEFLVNGSVLTRNREMRHPRG